MDALTVAAGGSAPMGQAQLDWAAWTVLLVAAILMVVVVVQGAVVYATSRDCDRALGSDGKSNPGASCYPYHPRTALGAAILRMRAQRNACTRLAERPTLFRIDHGKGGPL